MKKTLSLTLILISLCLLLTACGSGMYVNGAPAPAEEAPSGAAGTDAAADEGSEPEALTPTGEWQETDWNTEEYDVISESPFVAVADRPLSTFAADVDTASYANLRRLIREGYSLDQIPSGAIRTEELVNYFRYDYPAPARGEPFGVSAEISPCPWNSDTLLLVLGLATEPLDYENAPASNLVFLLDVSGSMDSPDKLPLLQDAFTYLVERLGPKDTVSIVTYAGEERVVLDGANGNEDKEILRAIRRLSAGGSTDGQSGLEMAYRLAQKNYIEGGNNRIIMASDGDLNVGMTSVSDLHDYVSEQRQNGVYLSVLGFGQGNYKDNKMETLADHGNGNYHYIDCLDEAEKVLGEDITATLLTVADDVKLQIEFNPAYVKGYRQIGYENRQLATADFKDDSKDGGEVGAGHQVTVAYELVPLDSDMEVQGTDLKYQDSGSLSGTADSGEWLTLSVRYKNPGASESRLLAYAFGEAELTDSPSRDWRFVSAVAALSLVIRDSAYKGDTSLDQVLDTLDGLDLSDPYREEFRDLVEWLE